jgi:hypothetical protein
MVFNLLTMDTYLTIVCKPEDGDDVAAALLQMGSDI